MVLANGAGPQDSGGGGGGAGGPGELGVNQRFCWSKRWSGVSVSINGTATVYAGGGSGFISIQIPLVGPPSAPENGGGGGSGVLVISLNL